MAFDPLRAAGRFGYGLSPRIPPVGDTAALLRDVQGEDEIALRYPMPSFWTMRDAMVRRRRFASFARKADGTQAGKEARKKVQQIKAEIRRARQEMFIATMLRRMAAPTGFRERLVAFWADHFTAFGGDGLLSQAAAIYVEEAIRPRIAGPFSELLFACVTHPMMIHYLDQFASAGPNSRAARLGVRRRGLNENLAREVLELHTLGVEGPYTQTDVRELARVFAGLALTRDYGFKFRPAMAEPGKKTVLGQQYGDLRGVRDVRQVLEDIAQHPATALHVARKLAVHFVSDNPPDALVQAVEQAYRQSDGNLQACYEALLNHPEAWTHPVTNIRPPVEYLSTALRVLGPPDAVLQGLTEREVRDLFFTPLRRMGQPWMAPAGPDGFEEADAAWVTPQGLAARLEWAMNIPARLMQDLPEPAVFVAEALGEHPPARVAFAASAAESRREAVGLVLASPAFQRR